MPKGKFVGNEGTVALRGVVRDGKLVGIIDHEEKERGIVLTDVNEVTGVIEFIVNGKKHRRVRRTPVLVATFGDSTASTGIPSGNLSDARQIAVAFPASGATTVGLNQTPRYLLQTLYPQAYAVADCGISGTTTASMVARDAGAYSTTRKAMKDCLDLGPDVVILRAGSPNDFSTVTSGTWRAQADTTFANHKILVSRAVAGGAIVIDEGFYGYGDGSGATATDPASVRLAVLYLNALYKAHAETLPGLVFFLDPQEAGIQEADGKFSAGVSYDGVHLGTVGGYRIAQKEAEILTSVFGPSGGVRYPGANLIVNSMFQDSASGLATGIQLPAGTNGAWSGQAIESIGGKIWQTAIFTPSAAAASGTMSIYSMINGFIVGATIDDVFGLEFDVLIQGQGANPVPTLVYGQLDIAKTGNGRIIEYSTVGYDNDTDTYTCHLVFQPIKLLDVTTILVNGAGGAGLLYKSDTLAPVKVGISNPRLVKLNQAVLTT